jgi:hypothetical protein
MRANFGKVEVDNSGKVGMGWAIEKRRSGRKGKSLDREGIEFDSLLELPKLDVAGSTPVARSKIL